MRRRSKIFFMVRWKFGIEILGAVNESDLRKKTEGLTYLGMSETGMRMYKE